MTPLKFEYDVDYKTVKSVYAFLIGVLNNKYFKRSAMMRVLQFGLGCALGAAILIVLVFFVMQEKSSAGILAVFFLFLFAGLSYLYQRQIITLFSRSFLEGEHRILLEVGEDGIQMVRGRHTGFFPWEGVKEVAEQSGWLAIIMKGIPGVLFVPDYAFVTPESREALITVLQDKGIAYKARHSDKLPDTGVAGTPFMTTGLKGLLRDFRALGSILLFRMPHSDVLLPSIAKFIVLPLLYALLIFLIQFVAARGEGSAAVSMYTVNWLLASFASMVLVAGLIVLAGSQSAQWGRLSLVFFLLLLIWPLSSFWERLYSNILSALFPEGPGSQEHLWRIGYILPSLWFVVAASLFAKRLVTRRRVLVFFLTMLMTCLVLVSYIRLPVLWYAGSDKNSYLDAEVTENVLYGQVALLEKQLAGIQAGKVGIQELYFLGVGGVGYQDVFLNEVRSVEQLFAEHYGTEGHSLVLVNNAETLETMPLANPESLTRALKRFGEQMNPDEDVLFLFLTSHGSRDHRFSFDFWPFSFTDLTPRMLRQALDDAGITRRVVVVSACYSGGFVPALQDDYTLVITAAAADRNSFGCSNGNAFTDFGRAYFDEALRETRSFTAAFDIARARIAGREAAESMTPSLPQMQGGERLKPLLERFAEERPDGVPGQSAHPDATGPDAGGK